MARTHMEITKTSHSPTHTQTASCFKHSICLDAACWSQKWKNKQFFYFQLLDFKNKNVFIFSLFLPQQNVLFKTGYLSNNLWSGFLFLVSDDQTISEPERSEPGGRPSMLRADSDVNLCSVVRSLDSVSASSVPNPLLPASLILHYHSSIN